MSIFNDHTSSDEEAQEMDQLKDGVKKAKDRLQEGREQQPIEEEPKPKSKSKAKKR